MADEVASLYASLGMRVDQGAWAKGDRKIADLRKAVGTISPVSRVAGNRLTADLKRGAAALGKFSGEAVAAGRRARGAFDGMGGPLRAVAAYFGGRAAYGGLIKFNSTVEDTKLQIAGMLSLAKKTDLVDQLKVADKLYASLQKRAAVLPGETAEYVAMAGKLTRVITDSGGSMKQLEDLTVNAVIAAKGLGENWEVAARDIEQALMGRYNTTDPFLSKVLPSIGYKGEEGREKWRAMSSKKRFAELERALMQKQFTQLGEAQGRTFSGRMSTFMDTLKQTAGAAGKGLFDQLTESLRSANEWLKKNETAIKDVAAALGGALLVAFDMASNALDIFVEGVKFFVEHSTLAQVALIALGAVLTAFAVRAAAAWVMALGPVGLIIAGVMAIIAAVGLLRKHWDKIGPAIGFVLDKIKAMGRRIKTFFTDDIPDAIRSAFEWLRNLPVIKQLVDLVAELRNFGKSDDPVSQDYIEKMRRLSSPDQSIGTPSIPATPGSGPVSINATMGDINVTSTSSDPVAVAGEVRKAVRQEFGNILRETSDAL